MFPNFVYTCKYITADVFSCFEGTTSHKVDVFCTSGTFGVFKHRTVIHLGWSEFLHVSFKNDGLLKSQISSKNIFHPSCLCGGFLLLWLQ